jgi:hypothetical protein
LTPAPVLLHRFLGIGLAALGLTFAVLTAVGVAPLLPQHDEGARIIGYAASGLAVLVILAALLVFKPRVPERPERQAVVDFWSTPLVVQRVMRVWFLLEGAGVLAGIAFLLTGDLVPLLTMAVAMVLYWICGPNRFAES